MVSDIIKHKCGFNERMKDVLIKGELDCWHMNYDHEVELYFSIAILLLEHLKGALENTAGGNIQFLMK